jgi:hypothetical protein
LGGCAGVPTKAIRDWASPNYPQFRKLVEEKYSDPDTRLQSYASMASLICDADTADKNPDSAACKCQHSVAPQQAQDCATFIQAYPIPQ